MYGARGETVSRDVCSHQQTVDSSEGDNVCIECGKVLGQVYATPPFFSGFRQFVSPDISAHEFIRDCGENANMPGCAIKYAENYYSKIKPSLLHRFSKNTIAAYALYESLNIFEVPRMADEIARYTGVCIKDIYKVESNLVLETPLNDPVKHVVSYCLLLNLSYPEQVAIRQTLESMQDLLPLGGLRSNCLSAVVIYLYCKDAKKKITLKKICETCNISATSVHRVLRQLVPHGVLIKNYPRLHWICNYL
jgi:transcription initiation factor TFIIIB Brf1 subunit/transcription initiation factor TFIIB